MSIGPPSMWSVLADTARLNEASKLPRHEIEEIPQPDGSVLFSAGPRSGPSLWRGGRSRSIGSSASGSSIAAISPAGRSAFSAPASGYRRKARAAASTIRWRRRPPTGWGASCWRRASFPAPSGTTRRWCAMRRPFARRRARDAVRIRGAGRGARGRSAGVDRLVAEIEATPNGHGLARRLADLVLKGQEVDLWHIRPLALARQWQTGPVRGDRGLPAGGEGGACWSCAGICSARAAVSPKSWVGTLGPAARGRPLPDLQHRLRRAISRRTSRRASARSPALRKLESGEYCLFGPMSTPHIKAADPARAGRGAQRPGRPDAGALSAAHLGAGAGMRRRIRRPAAFPELIVVSADAVTAGPLGAPGEIALVNRSDRPRVAIVEDRSWLARLPHRRPADGAPGLPRSLQRRCAAAGR